MLQAGLLRFRSMPLSRSPLETGFALSLLLHGFLWLGFSWKAGVEMGDAAVDPLEIDLSRPFRLTDDPSRARRAERPGAGAPVVQNPTPIPGKGVLGGEEQAPGDAKGAAKDWILPTPETKKLETPAPGEAAGTPDGQGEGAGLGGLGGEGDGEVDWVYLTALPSLLNRDEIARNMKRFYPDEERRAGREGRVGLFVHIDSEGRIRRLEVAESAGAAFDEAAKRVLSPARFSPARVKDKAVPVKIRQAVDFRLE